MKTAQVRARWVDEVEEVFEECRQSISQAMKEYKDSIDRAIDELKVSLKSDV